MLLRPLVLALVLGFITASAQTLAYLQDGNLTLRTAGETSRTLARDVTQFSFSADGRSLAYLQSGSLYLVRDGNSQRLLLGVQGFSWSPVGETLAILSESGTLVYNVSTRERRTLPLSASLWSPDGTRLAYVQTELLETTDNATPLRRLELGWLEVESGEQTTLYSAEATDTGYLLAGWTPSGNALLAWTQPLFSASLIADGTTLVRLSPADPDPLPLIAPALPQGGFSLTSNPARLAIGLGGGRSSWDNKRLAVLNLTDGTQELFTPPGVAVLNPVWSPGGSRLAYIAAPEAPGSLGGDDAEASLRARRLWLINADGFAMTQLTDDERYRDEFPMWSPDGDSLLFLRFDAAEDASLWRISAHGGEPEVVLERLDFPDAFGFYGFLEPTYRVAW